MYEFVLLITLKMAAFYLDVPGPEPWYCAGQLTVWKTQMELNHN